MKKTKLQKEIWKGGKFNKKKFMEYVNRGHPNIKSIKIVVTRRDGKKVELPISKYEIFQLSDWVWVCHDECGNIKLNKLDLSNIKKKIQHLEYDIVNEGRCCDFKGKTIKKRWYLIKKPKWKEK